MKKNEFISPSSVIENCTVGKGIRVFKNVNLKRSSLGDNLRIGDESIIYDSHIANNVEINRRNLILESTVGRYSYTGINTVIRSANLGNFCSISWGVSIGGADHPHSNFSTLRESKFEFLDKGVSENTYEDYSLPCIIGNDVLVSTNVIILRNVKIGDGAIIGAGSVVTRDVEPYAIMAGVPARKIKMRFPLEIIEELVKIKWWEWPIDIIREYKELLFSTEIDDIAIRKMKEIDRIKDQIKWKKK